MQEQFGKASMLSVLYRLGDRFTMVRMLRFPVFFSADCIGANFNELYHASEQMIGAA